MELNKFLLFLKCVKGIGDSSIRKLIQNHCFRNLELESQENILKWIKSHSSFFSKRFNVNKLSVEDLNIAKTRRIEILNKLEKEKASYITYFDDNYPQRFKDIEDFPIVLFYKGDINLLNSEKTCSIIGTRDPSDETIKIGKEITKQMVEKGYVIISGLALGCDTLAHQACLDNNGKTIAILGNGIDMVYPKENRELADNILATGGLLITEELVGQKPAAYALVSRDRLQAAGADTVIVLETPIDGGSMHAGSQAKIKYGKELLVVDPALIPNGKNDGNKELIMFNGGKAIKEIKILN